MEELRNRQWLLARRPTGTADVKDFTLNETTFSIPDLKPGQVVLKNSIFLLAPTIRNWLDAPGNNFYPSIPIGAPVLSPAGGQVIASADARFPVGSRVSAISSWQDYEVVDTTERGVRPMPRDSSDVDAMGPLGMNALTAYFGLVKIGRPKVGETLVVSGAAGSAGSSAAQIGKIMGARVVGIAGGPEKCDWLVSECGLDAAIDYKSGALTEQLARVCPDGIDVFFDNVGGSTLQAAVDNMARFGRIVLCGQIAGYDNSVPIPGPQNMMRLIYGSIRMQGFLLGDFEEQLGEGWHYLEGWLRDGTLVHREDVRTGFATIPENFPALFDGSNRGTLLITAD